MALFLCLLLCVCAEVFGFNVHVPSRVVYKGRDASMFGFTVQAHVDGDKKMILVGAPEDDPYPVQGVEKPGAVFKCEPTTQGFLSPGQYQRPLDHCAEMVFDKNRVAHTDKEGHPIDQKSGQWFGATLSSTGRNGPIVACAPRYVSYVTHRLNQRDPVGSCYVAMSSDARDVNEFSPCRHSSHGQRKTGVCQAGFSAALSKDGQRLFMGAPGSFYWQGQIYSQDTLRKPALLATPEANPIYDDSYMGYSVAVGDFAGEGDQGVAVGVPRGSNLTGLVVLYNWELNIIKNITGSQIGAYFGYCLASGDIDGDGVDDLIVGAPMFTRPKRENEYEHGRIYVIYGGRDRSYSRNHARTGEISRGRFGLAVTSLGDINLDGFGDIAVGAPYGGENGRGVVYIYHGSELGISEKYSQAIKAEEISPTLSTFGFSLSGGVDLDNNNYTDLAVGAYKSDSVVFLRSSPVVKVTALVQFMGDTKLISMEDRRCTLPRNGTRVACAAVQFCLTYNGINVDRHINFEVNLEMDSRHEKNSKRLHVLETRDTVYKTHVSLQQGTPECQEVTVYLDDNIRDKLTPLEVMMTYNLLVQGSSPGVVPPVLDQTHSISHTDSLNIQKNCGSDNVCVPNLFLLASTPTLSYVLGSRQRIHIDVTVGNEEEDAFEAAYYLHIPYGVTFVKAESQNKDVSPVYCFDIGGRTRVPNSKSTIKCEVGNPLASKQKVVFSLEFEVDSSFTATDKLQFGMEVNSTNPEQGTTGDNYRQLDVSVVYNSVLTFIGSSDPPELHYNASLYQSSQDVSDDTKLGPQIIHKYNIKNEGQIDGVEAVMHIMWPYQTLEGDDLMYMLVQPQMIGDVRCDVSRFINPRNLSVQNPYTALLTKERQAMESTHLYESHQLVIRGDFGQNIGANQFSSGQYYGSQYGQGSNQYGQSGSHFSQGGSQFSQGGGQFSQGGSQISQGGSQFSQGGTQISQEGGHYGQSGGQSSQVGGHYGSQGVYGTSLQGQYGSQSGRGSSETYNRESYGDGFTAEEEESIRRQLAGAVGSGQVSGAGIQGHGRVVRLQNRTIVYDEHNNIISQTETSTEYGSLGHEGEAGSSFNRYNERHNAFGSGQTGFVHGNWATTETVNSNVANGVSTTYRHANSDVTVVGDEEEDRLEGFGASAAQGSSNQFRYGIGDVSGGIGGGGGASGRGQGGTFGSAQGGSYQGGTQGGSYQSGSYQGGAQGASYQGGAQGASYQGGTARNGGGYSYAYQSGYHRAGGASYSKEQRDNTRKRRQIDTRPDPELESMLAQCKEKYNCAVLQCYTGTLKRGQEVWVALRSRVNANVLNEISKDRAVKLSTLAATKVTRIQKREISAPWQKAEAQTVVTPQLEALENGTIPLWVVVLAAVVGALLLLLLIFALYKCGFFKRNRPSDHAERQPLKGRDEHL